MIIIFGSRICVSSFKWLCRFTTNRPILRSAAHDGVLLRIVDSPRSCLRVQSRRYMAQWYRLFQCQYLDFWRICRLFFHSSVGTIFYHIRGIRMPDVRWFILARRDRKATALVTVVKRESEPNRLIAAFADYLACETGNSMPDGMPENVGTCCVEIMNCVFTGCAPIRITILLFLPGLIKWYGIKTLVK